MGGRTTHVCLRQTGRPELADILPLTLTRPLFIRSQGRFIGSHLLMGSRFVPCQHRRGNVRGHDNVSMRGYRSDAGLARFNHDRSRPLQFGVDTDGGGDCDGNL
jgi:hypothetical protein